MLNLEIQTIRKIIATKELIKLEEKRASGEQISLSRLPSLYVKLLDQTLINALATVKNKDLCALLAITAKVDLRVAQQAISALKRKQAKNA